MQTYKFGSKVSATPAPSSQLAYIYTDCTLSMGRCDGEWEVRPPALICRGEENEIASLRNRSSSSSTSLMEYFKQDLQLYKTSQSTNLQCSFCAFYTAHIDFTTARIVINCTLKYALTSPSLSSSPPPPPPSSSTTLLPFHISFLFSSFPCFFFCSFFLFLFSFFSFFFFSYSFYSSSYSSFSLFFFSNQIFSFHLNCLHNTAWCKHLRRLFPYFVFPLCKSIFSQWIGITNSND